MIIKKEYKTNNIIKYTTIDDIDKIDSGIFDDGVKFINIYRKDRKKDDDFETIRIESLVVYVCNNEGKTLQIYR